MFTALLIAAGMEAVNLLGFDRLSDLTGQFVVFGGQILFGLVVIAVGLFLANIVANAVTASSISQARTVAVIARVVIIFFAAAVGLQEMGIANEIVLLAFALPLGALSLARAIAVGIGGRELAARELAALRERLDGDSSPSSSRPKRDTSLSASERRGAPAPAFAFARPIRNKKSAPERLADAPSLPGRGRVIGQSRTTPGTIRAALACQGLGKTKELAMTNLT